MNGYIRSPRSLKQNKQGRQPACMSTWKGGTQAGQSRCRKQEWEGANRFTHKRLLFYIKMSQEDPTCSQAIVGADDESDSETDALKASSRRPHHRKADRGGGRCHPREACARKGQQGCPQPALLALVPELLWQPPSQAGFQDCPGTS